MESFLKSDGDKIDILFACNDDMALGAIQAIEAAGLNPGKDIVIVSIDAAKGAFNAMIEGKMNCAVEHTPNFGEILMDTTIKIVNGVPVPKTIEVQEGIFPADIAKQELPNRTY
jgi:simple sugar transport system substrate-binding protein